MQTEASIRCRRKLLDRNRREIRTRITKGLSGILAVTLGTVFISGCALDARMTAEVLTPTMAGGPPFTPIRLPTDWSTATMGRPAPTATLPTGTPSVGPPATFAIEDSDLVAGSILVRRGHGAISDLAISPDGNRLAGASQAGVFSYRLDDLEGVLTASVEGSVGDVAFSPEGDVLLAGWRDQRVVIWDAQTGEERFSMEGHSGPLTSVAWSPDGKWLASGSEDETVIVWDATTGEQVRVLEGYTGAAERVGWSPQGHVGITSSWYDLVVWDVTAEGVDSAENFINPMRSPRSDLDSTPQRDMVAKTLADGTLEVSFTESTGIAWWDEPVHMLSDETSVIGQLMWSPEGRRLASGSQDGKVILWDGRAGLILSTLEGQESAISSLAWSPDGDLLAAGSVDGTLIVWQTGTCAVLPSQGGLAQARNTLVRYYDELATGNYAWAPDQFGLSSLHAWHQGRSNPMVDESLMAGLCSWYRCLPVKDVVGERIISPILYEFVIEFENPDGSTYRDQQATYPVMMDCNGNYRVMGFPIYES